MCDRSLSRGGCGLRDMTPTAPSPLVVAARGLMPFPHSVTQFVGRRTVRGDLMFGRRRPIFVAFDVLVDRGEDVRIPYPAACAPI